MQFLELVFQLKSFRSGAILVQLELSFRRGSRRGEDEEEWGRVLTYKKKEDWTYMYLNKGEWRGNGAVMNKEWEGLYTFLTILSYKL